MVELGRAALAGGYAEEAGDALRRATALPGASWDAFLAHGAYAARVGDLSAAEASFSRALAKAPSPRDAMSAMANLALLKAERGDLRGAVADLEGLARRPGAHPRIHATLALLHGLSGDKAAFRREAAKGMPASEAERAARWLDGN